MPKKTRTKTYTGVYDSVLADDLQGQILRMEDIGWAVRQVAGKWFGTRELREEEHNGTLYQGHEFVLRFSGAVVYERPA